MDGRRFIDALFSSQKAQSITQVVMNLPNDAAEYLGIFIFLQENIFFWVLFHPEMLYRGVTCTVKLIYILISLH